jgi:hypothetical protein
MNNPVLINAVTLILIILNIDIISTNVLMLMIPPREKLDTSHQQRAGGLVEKERIKTSFLAFYQTISICKNMQIFAYGCWNRVLLMVVKVIIVNSFCFFARLYAKIIG